MATPTRIEIEEEIEGGRIESNDFFFDEIGESIPIIRDDDSQFDLQNPPSLPLAVSQLSHQLIFAAHSSGFCVARTNDVIDAAKEMKENGTRCCVQELSVVDVPFENENVDILSLSNDESTLAVSLYQSPHILFFSVHSLLNKEIKPSFSCSLNGSTYVKDIRWRKKPENSFLALSNVGRLYRGGVNGPLEDVMDNVDAVEWSVKGKFVAVAKKNVLSILTSKLKERLPISLSFKSWVGDCDVNCSVKVDSIRWVRRDCIIIGCFQLTEDGKEENYLVQVIQSKDGKITDASSEPVVLSFSDVFSDVIDDILPSGTGPYLFLTYVEQWGLAISANRKNIDDHVVLLRWSLDDEKNDIAVVDINRDKWIPRIKLQDNGNDNLIMGLCIDKVSLCGKVKVQLGVEEKELSPYFILMCLTLDGKLNMFHVASVSGPSCSPDVDFTLSDAEDDVPAVVPVDSNLPRVYSGSGLQKIEPVASSFKSQGVKLKELDTDDTCGVTAKSNLKGFDKYESSTSISISNSQELENKDRQQIQNSLQKSTNLVQSPPKASLPEVTSFGVRDSSKTGTQDTGGFGLGSTGFVGKFPTDTPSLSSHKDLLKSLEFGKEAQGNFGSAGLQSLSSQSQSCGNFISLEDSRVKLPVLPSSHSHEKSYENSSLGAPNVSGSFVGKPLSSKDATGSLTPVFSAKPVHGDGDRASTGAGKIESLPSVRSSQFSLPQNFASGKSHNQKLYPSKDDYKTATLSGLPNSEPNLSKQSGNIKEMTKELDMLLQSIEETGGFRDACTVFQRQKVEELEEGIGSLSEKCGMWRSIMDERLQEIQNLFDKTVQVLARKIYTEGIVKQASDSRYWDLWNRQKLSPELELKRGHILSINQDLINQLIELERHFNSLELNKFGENDGVHGCQRRPQSRFGTSRHIQSLHSLHTTMSSQIAAAEQLSDRLSKQMALLSIESPVKQQNVKKELFETLGIPYDASFSSPDVTKVMDQSSIKKLIHSSGSAATNDQSRRRQSSAMKSYDPETARRRRDSLDRSWASFEPPKTTVKRMLLQDHQKCSQVKSLLKDKQQISPHMLEGAAIVRPKDRTTPSTSWNPLRIKGLQDASLKQTSESQSTLFKWAGDPTGPSQMTGLKSPVFQSNIASTRSSLSATQLSPMGWQNHARNAGDVTAEKLSSGVYFDVKSNSTLTNETKSTMQSESNIFQKPTISTMSPTLTPSLLKNPSEMPISNGKGTVPESSTIGSEKHGAATTKTLFVESGKNRDAQVSTPAAVPTSSAFPGIVPIFDAANKSQPGGKSFTPSTFSLSLSASSSPMVSSLSTPMFSFSTSSSATSSSTASFGGSSSSSKTTIDTKETVSSTSVSSTSPLPIVSSSPPSASLPTTSSSPIVSSYSLSATSSTTFPSSSSATLQAPKTPISSSTPSVNSIPESKTELQLSTDKADSKPDVSVVQLTSPVFESSSKLEPLRSSVSAGGISSGLASGSPANFTSIASSVSNMALNSQPEHSSIADTLLSTQVSTSASTTGGKNDSWDIAVTQEDEMEEEAPETSQATELSLGSLGSFGIGSTPNRTAPKLNPFGSPFGNATTSPTSSPFTMTVPSGQLFRPASFTVQSPESSQPSQPATFSAFSGFGTGATAQAPTQTGFGQPAQVGQGQQALGSVLGSFGQSRQLGASLPGAGFASASGFGGGFAPASSTSSFPSAATGGGFAGIGSTTGGFAGLASGGGGFGAAASGGGGFVGLASGGFGGAASGSGGSASSASGGFGGAASVAGGFSTVVSAGGGFGGFATPGGGGGFAAAGGGFGAFSGQGSGFGRGAGGSGKPPELFTQMRK